MVVYAAFDVLHQQSQHSDRRLIEIAEVLVQSHALLLSPFEERAKPRR